MRPFITLAACFVSVSVPLSVGRERDRAKRLNRSVYAVWGADSWGHVSNDVIVGRELGFTPTGRGTLGSNACACLNLLAVDVLNLCLQCFDAVGWAAGRASGL